MKATTRVLVCLLVLFVAATEAWSQGFQGGVRGAVRDPGGVIPGAEVTLTNENTGVTRTTVTNDRGEYNFPNLDPGNYTLKASLQGYKTFEQRGLRVGTQQFLTLDVTLEVGQLQETITVTGQSPLVETSNASTGEVLDAQELSTLPSPGRAAFLIGVTVPTVIATGDAQFNRQQDQTNASLVSLGGGARRANNYILDGVPISDLRNRAVANPSIEGIEEVKVQVHTFDAEMGRTGGGVFNTTAKSGTNDFRGSGMFQTRPVWGQSNNWFQERAVPQIPKPTDLNYRLYAGGVGGPVVRNRTFFHFAAEGYRSITTRNGALRFPTDRERAGDFSQSLDRNGNLLVIHNPFDPNRAPFAGNVIPTAMMDPVGRAVVNLMPRADDQVSREGVVNYRRTASIQDAADLIMAKGDHKFTDKVSLSGVYMYNKTDEPFAVYWQENLFQDPAAAPLLRRIHVGVVNNTWIPNSSTVIALRYGQTSFVDNCGIAITEFDPATLGFASSFTNTIVGKKHPRVVVDGFGQNFDGNFGAGSFTAIDWNSWGFNGAISKLFGSHTMKLGADYRWIGVLTTPFGQGSGTFGFGPRYTANNAGVGGTSLASLLLGVPRTGESVIPSTSEFFTNYYGGYFQDDWRVKSNLTLNYGVRVEHEDGLRETNDQFTVGFDQNVVSPLSGRAAGLAAIRGTNEIRGGLMYAGVGGNNTYQGDPPSMKVSPRVGVVYSFTPRAVLRAGYGVFWAPWNYQFPGTTNYGNVGYTQTTEMQQSAETAVPITRLQNPFPAGLVAPSGNAGGLLTGVSNDITTIDQNKKAPYVQQVSADFQYQLTDSIAVSAGWAHARGEDLGLGGTNDAAININQIRPEVAARYTPAQLLENVANPFFGVPGFGANGGNTGGFASRATIPRGQLLRPYPQFGNISILQSTLGKSRYNAMILQLNKRVSGGWGGRFNYTWSRLEDNQFGESNHFTNRGTGRPQNNYDIDAEYSVGLLDVPHKLIFAPIVELPFGQGKRWATGRLADLIVGGWTFSAVAAFESGFPTAARYQAAFTQNRMGLFGDIEWRPNHVAGDPNTPGDLYERIQTGQNPNAFWMDREGYEQPAPGQFGNGPRLDTRIRSPFRKNLDLVINKGFRTGGSTRAEVRFEMLNLTNTPKFRAYEVRLDQGSLGAITNQSGFMRITQVSLRFSF